MPYSGQYVPVVKWRLGEQKAIEQLGDNIKARITPLVEIDALSSTSKKTVEEHVASSIDQLATVWGRDYSFFLDPALLTDEDSPSAFNIAEDTFSQAEKALLAFVPVVGIDRSEPEVEAVMNHLDRGACLRLTLDDLDEPNWSRNLMAFIEYHSLAPESVDIVLDFGSIEDDHQAMVQALALNILDALPEIQRWRSLILVATAFPNSMGVVPRNGSARMDRVEWIVWNWLYEQRDSLRRMPWYGDYGIQHPAVVDFDPKVMSSSAAIRYTLDSEWLFIKGESMKKGGGQFKRLARILVDTADYFGSEHCPGCEFIWRFVKGQEKKAGSQTVWRRIGTAHHFSLAIEQLRSLP